MTNSIRELTEKIYNEGVVKANKEAEIIIAAAKKEAEEIINSANLEKKVIADEAKKEADELKKKANSEIALAAQKLISNLKQHITETFISKQIGSLTVEVFNDEKFVKDMLLLVVKNWTDNEKTDSDISLLVPQNEEKKIASYFENKLIGRLDQGLEIKVDPSFKNGFKIGPKNGNYIISFTEKDFENYFKSYLKEKTRKLIFGSD